MSTKLLQDWIPFTNYLEKAVDIADYSAKEEDELTFLKGELIYVLKKHECGWCEGWMFEGKKGFFPGNYVEKIEEADILLALGQDERSNEESARLYQVEF